MRSRTWYGEQELAAIDGVDVVEGVDVTDDARCVAMANELKAHGPIDVLINNAGYFYGGPSLLAHHPPHL